MNYFDYRNGRLHAEDVDLTALVAQYGTPCYVYSRAAIETRWRAFDDAFAAHDHLVCYAVKANSNIGVLNVLARLGSGFDIVSRGELERVLKAGCDPRKVVFSGVGKSAEEIAFALHTGIHCFNVESEVELHEISRIATELRIAAPVSLRINPDVDAGTHPYISTGLKENKFGIDIQDAPRIYAQAARLPYIQVIGVDCHIGSQLTDLTPFRDALTRVLALVQQLEADGIHLQHLDLGGGLGIQYQNETPPAPADYAQVVLAQLRGRKYQVILEPGRAIVGNAGVLLTQVMYLKHTAHKNFAIVDAAMNDLIRPALYGAWQNIIPLLPRTSGSAQTYDIVGPVCETGDFLGKQRELNLAPGDALAVCSAGAYGFVMSSNYNSRPRAAELLVDGSLVHVIRRRETLAELTTGENVLPS
ncbi:MAG: diaminopimelate decarboxylase [Gammaproteobacteria bacterium]|nr:diaminopimelate decarboxylase [Gammaproteobacteria bacterium]